MHPGALQARQLTRADSDAEQRTAIDLINRQSPGSTRRLMLAADRGYDSAEFVAEPRRMNGRSLSRDKPLLLMAARHGSVLMTQLNLLRLSR